MSSNIFNTIIETKICSVCKVEKSQQEFHKYFDKRSNKTKLRSPCKRCEYLATKKWKENNKERVKKTESEWYWRTKDQKLEHNREIGRNWYHKTKIVRKNKIKNNVLNYDFGITLEIYNRMLNEQNGLCAICLKPETSTIKGNLKSLSVDHNHETGEIRQLLCIKCNTGIGMLKDSIEILKNAINYLEKHSYKKVFKSV